MALLTSDSAVISPSSRTQLSGRIYRDESIVAHRVSRSRRSDRTLKCCSPTARALHTCFLLIAIGTTPPPLSLSLSLSLYLKYAVLIPRFLSRFTVHNTLLLSLSLSSIAFFSTPRLSVLLPRLWNFIFRAFSNDRVLHRYQNFHLIIFHFRLHTHTHTNVRTYVQNLFVYLFTLTKLCSFIRYLF